MIGKAVEIPIADDCPKDIEATCRFLNKSEILNNISTVCNGVELLDYLKKTNGYQEVKTPDFTLLDIKMSNKNGLEALEEIKTNDAMNHIPIVMLTSSIHDEDILKSYKNYANCYIKKPVDSDQFKHILSCFENFWQQVVSLPS